MSLRRSGLNPLAYMGVEPLQPPDLVVDDRDPTPNDYQNFNLGTLWLNKNNLDVWMLVSKSGGISDWVKLSGGGGGPVLSVETDSGLAMPDITGLLNVIGGDSGSGTNINTEGSGNTVEVRLNNDIVVDSVTTTPATAHEILSGTSLVAAGSNANIDLTIQAKGAGDLELLSTDSGGTAHLTTDSNIFITSSSGSIFNSSTVSYVVSAPVQRFDGISSGFALSLWNLEQAGVQTTDATPTFIFGKSVGTSRCISIKGWINGFTAAFDQAVGAEVWITAYRSAVGNVTLVGTPVINVNSTTTATVTADVDVGTQFMRILVTGVALTTYNWVGSFYSMSLNTNA